MRLALAAAVLLLAAPVLAQKSPMTYPQLISTRYTDRSQLPPDFQKPTPDFRFVDRTKLPSGATILSAAKAANGVIWVVTDKGAFRQRGGRSAPLQEPGVFKTQQPQITPDTIVTQVASDRSGHIWAATTTGLYATDGGNWWQSLDRREGMPYETMTCLHLASNGDVWGGTEQGAWRMRAGKFRYFWGKRWLPGNKVSAVWTDAKGRAWLETDGGVACIEERPMTLGEKAAHFDKITQARHNRRGFISEIVLKVPGDPSKGATYDVSDNDGLWNAIYVGAMAFRYAATKDPAARKQAQEAMNAMLELERLTGIPGYPARAVVTDEEIKAGIYGVNFDDTVRVPGETDKIWFRSPVEKNVWCKGDTSSDEMDGHYFAWYVYYELVADEEEKKKIASVVRRATDHIIKGGYNLIGHTGRKTRWGIWAPELLNDDPFWWEQRPLNSQEMLAYLKIAQHITGDAKYGKAYDELAEKHHYLLNMLLLRRGHFGLWHNINHSDDEMLYMMYYPLLLLEKDPDRLRILTQSITRTWEETPNEQSIKPERSPLYNFIYGATTGHPCSVEDAVESLQDWPWDPIQWTVQNKHRHDVTFKTAPGLNSRGELTRVLPVSERRLMRWNGNVWSPDGGSDGRAEDDCAAWSLAYWVGVYHGYLPKP